MNITSVGYAELHRMFLENVVFQVGVCFSTHYMCETLF